MKICHLLLSSFLVVSLAHGASFEPPQYQADQGLPEQEGWQSEGGVLISSAESQDGTQSLVVPPNGRLSREFRAQGISYLDFYTLPAFADAPSEPVFSLEGVELSFVRQASGDSVAIFTKDEIVLVPFDGFTAASKERPEDGWVRLTFRVDSVKNVADLYINGLPAMANLPLDKKKGAFEVNNGADAEIYLDSWNELSENPLFTDSDHDGMPDAEEIALGLNAYGDDREGDLDGDGVSNVLEVFSGRLPNSSSEGGMHRGGSSVLYVDNLHGNDMNTGAHSYLLSGRQGPKATINAAMVAASNGSVITVLKGAKPYQETSLGIAGKRLLIKTVEPIVIK